MSKKRNFERYEIGRKTSTDVLENEKSEVDEIELMEMKPQNKNKDFRTVHREFLEKLNPKQEENDIRKLKEMQMQVYASNSSELYFLSSKASIFMSILSVVLAMLLVVVGFVAILFNFMDYRLVKYDNDDMEPKIEQGTVLVVKNSNVINIGNEGTIIMYNSDYGEVARIIVDVDNLIIDTIQGGHQETIPLTQVDERITGLVLSYSKSMGNLLWYLSTYWYLFGGGILFLIVVCIVIKILIDRHFNILLLNTLELEREHRAKRRAYLAKEILKMQNSKNFSDENMAILSELLHVEDKPKTKREKKIAKLEKQLRQRQQNQIEGIKKIDNQQEDDQNKENAREEKIVTFLRSELKDKEKEKNTLSEEEIEKRKKMAEDINRNV